MSREVGRGGSGREGDRRKGCTGKLLSRRISSDEREATEAIFVISILKVLSITIEVISADSSNVQVSSYGI